MRGCGDVLSGLGCFWAGLAGFGGGILTLGWIWSREAEEAGGGGRRKKGWLIGWFGGFYGFFRWV